MKKIILYQDLPPILKSIMDKIDDTYYTISTQYGKWAEDMNIIEWIESIKNHNIEITKELEEELMPYIFCSEE